MDKLFCTLLLKGESGTDTTDHKKQHHEPLINPILKNSRECVSCSHWCTLKHWFSTHIIVVIKHMKYHYHQNSNPPKIIQIILSIVLFHHCASIQQFNKSDLYDNCNIWLRHTLPLILYIICRIVLKKVASVKKTCFRFALQNTMEISIIRSTFYTN